MLGELPSVRADLGDGRGSGGGYGTGDGIDADDGRLSSPASRAESAPAEMQANEAGDAAASAAGRSLRPPSAAAIAATIGDEAVLATLCEIEHICNELRDAVPVIAHDSVALVEAVLRPSLIAPRTPVSLNIECKTLIQMQIRAMVTIM